MAVNAVVLQIMIVLGQAFINHERQDEKFGISKFDPHLSEDYNLAANQVEFYIFPHHHQMNLFRFIDLILNKQ